MKIGPFTVPSSVASLVERMSPSRVQTTGPSGTMDGVKVQQSATNRTPTPSRASEAAAAFAKFFTTSVPSAFSGAAGAIWTKIKPQTNAAPPAQANLPPLTALPDATFTAGPVKDIKDFTFPGDFYESGDKHGVSTRQEAFGSVYATAKSKAEQAGANPSQRSNFLRDNAVATAKTAKMEGAPLAAFARSTAVTLLTSDRPLAFTAMAYKKGESAYTDVRDGTQSPNASKQAREAVRTAERVYGEFFGTPGDQASITRAASRFPQSFCNAVAVAVKGIDDAQLSAEVKTELRNKVMTDMIALRVINPNIQTPQPGETALDNRTQRNLLEFSKFAQNITNNVPMGVKEPIHPAAAKELAKRNTEANLQAGFREFCSAVLARADQAVVSQAVTDGVQMMADFTNRPPKAS